MSSVFAISEKIEIPAAEYKGRGWFWFRCSICGQFSMRRHKWTLAEAHVCKGCAAAHNAHGEHLESEHRIAQRSAQWDIIHAVTDHCDVSRPDNIDSPGALWLIRVHDAMEEAWDYGRFTSDSGEEESDVIIELADSIVPIYTHNRWQVFTDLCAYDADVEPGFWAGNDDLTEIAGVFLAEIARNGMNSWLQEKRENSKCEKCDEFPCECCEKCGEFYCECSEYTGSPLHKHATDE